MANSSGRSKIAAAFRSAHVNEAYIFMKDEYVVDNYSPGLFQDKIVFGPTKISEAFPSLKSTMFADGIDCAFASHDKGKAYIFYFDNCALFDYAPYSGNDKIIDGPKPIGKMFPFFNGTPFENGIDAAFESSIPEQAYLFKGSTYACINYAKPSLITMGQISHFCPDLKGYSDSDIEAALASHVENEAYLFKGGGYVHLKFVAGVGAHVAGAMNLKDGWAELEKVLLSMN